LPPLAGFGERIPEKGKSGFRKLFTSLKERKEGFFIF